MVLICIFSIFKIQEIPVAAYFILMGQELLVTM